MAEPPHLNAAALQHLQRFAHVDYYLQSRCEVRGQSLKFSDGRVWQLEADSKIPGTIMTRLLE